MSEQESKLRLEISPDDEEVAYLRLPSHPGSTQGVVARTLSLRDLIGDYTGPDLNFDFDKDNVLIGVEVLV